MVDYLRHCVGTLRRAAPGEASLAVRSPSALRFLIAALCGWALWQPLKGSSQPADAGTLFTAVSRCTSNATRSQPYFQSHSLSSTQPELRCSFTAFVTPCDEEPR